MRQALAIFRKDIRRQGFRLALPLTLTVLVGCVDQPTAPGGIADLLYLVWIVCWIYVGTSVIQQESLPGDRQYWLTRPYDWRSLLAAKLLFAILFAALPLLAVKCAVLWVNGVSPLRHAGDILLRTLAFVSAVALLSGALAAVTRTLLQFLWALLALGGIVAAAIVLGVNYGGDWGGLAWMRSTAVEALSAGAGLAILLLQYRWRRTFAARAILSGAAVLAAAAPMGNAWHSAWGIESSLHAPASPVPVQLSFDTVHRPPMAYSDAPLFPRAGAEGVYLPIRISGIPQRGGVLSQRVAVTVEAGSGQQWRSGWRETGALLAAGSHDDRRLLLSDGPAWQYVDLDRTFYEAVRRQPVRIRVTAALMLLSGPVTAAMQGLGHRTRVPLDGICQAFEIPNFSYNLRGARGVHNVEAFCAWPQPGPARAYVRSGDSAGLLASGPAPLSTDQSAWRRAGTLIGIRSSEPAFAIESWHASAYLERSFEASGINLQDYRAPRVTDPQ